jgi:acyl-coenzyme A thioesterase PaaI-like protein|uniref:Acyl-coenzyme A thioesterase THEM4 n=1 Tax=Caulobacter sp. (strain K31) TaxID=366602 RepID=B0T4Q8_CAUSK
MDNRVARCRGCQVGDRPCRFGADSFDAISPDEGVARVTCPADFDGGPEVAHGGWIAGLFDDVLGRFLTHGGVRSVTATLSVSFLMPVPVERPLVLRTRIVSREGRRITMAGTLRLEGETQDRATAEGVWVERRPDHFERHRAQMSGSASS